MSVGIGSNIAALRAQRQLAGSSGNLSRIFERLSSGSRINRASDDAAGLAVSSGLNARQRIYSQGIRNLNDGISALSIVDNALAGLSGIVTRQRELAEQSANGVFSGTQRVSLNKEAQELAAEYRRVLEGTTFNGINLLDPRSAFLTLQAGIGGDATISVETLRRITSTQFDFADTVISGATFGQGDGSPVIGNLYRNMNLFVLDYDNDGYDDLLAVGLQDGGANLNYGITLFKGSASGLTEVSDRSDTVTYDGGTFSIANAFVVFSDNVLSVGVGDGSDYVLDQISIPSNGNLPGSTIDLYGIGVTFDTSPVLSVNTGDFNNDGINDTVTFNGILTANGKALTVSLSYEAGTSSTFESIEQNILDLLTSQGSLSALDDLATLLQTLTQARGRIGVALSRVETATQVLSDTREQLTAAESRIRDTDIGFDSSELVRETILQQAGAAVLAQANIQPQLALTLLESAGV